VLPFECRTQVDDGIFQRKGLQKLVSRWLAREMNEPTPEVIVAELFTDNLEAYLIQSRKFMVLDRRSRDAIGGERDFTKDSAANVEDILKAFQDVSAELIVVGGINEVSYNEREHKMRSGRTVMIEEGTVALTYKIIEVATRQVKFSDTVACFLPADEIKKTAGSRQIKQPGPVMLKIAANRIGSQILAAIYPLRVIGLNGKRVTLNQGGRTMEKGAVLDVFTLGDKKVDPYTGENLGREEIFVGKLRVTRVKPKMSEAEIIDGMEEIAEGDICRLSSDQQTQGMAKPSSADTNTDDLF
jgi:hypothetical protein